MRHRGCGYPVFLMRVADNPADRFAVSPGGFGRKATERVDSPPDGGLRPRTSSPQDGRGRSSLNRIHIGQNRAETCLTISPGLACTVRALAVASFDRLRSNRCRPPETDNPADRSAVGPGGFDRNAIERVVRVAQGADATVRC